MQTDQKNQGSQVGNKSKGMQHDKNKSGSKNPGQPSTGSGQSGTGSGTVHSSGNRGNTGMNK
jgi:hypothetical protein